MDRERLLMLHHCEGIGWKHIHHFLTFDPTLEKIYKMSSRELSGFFHLKTDTAARLSRHLTVSSFKKLANFYRREKISLIVMGDEQYPSLLQCIFDPPWVLYAKGNIEYFSRTSISVVGTRNPTPYGISSLRQILVPLIEKGWTTVSGLAAGIDTEVHRLSVISQRPTIAVLGHGLGTLYPSRNAELAGMIEQQGILVTEFPFYNKPNKWQFPQRNRIISGLSPGTLVVEAREKSGSLITADQALDQGREVFAVPGPIHEPCSFGTNSLIQNGAKLTACSDDILTEYPKYFSKAFS
ncbi:DNA-processing protein DprA [Fictibacillus iocasae]|uniref:DNA-processing protein DprA n=1 Tax=Fictibacillus iocasae TaxID=2715437 RepID=A0ABW2NVW1_9BACL